MKIHIQQPQMRKKSNYGYEEDLRNLLQLDKDPLQIIWKYQIIKLN